MTWITDKKERERGKTVMLHFQTTNLSFFNVFRVIRSLINLIMTQSELEQQQAAPGLLNHDLTKENQFFPNC